MLLPGTLAYVARTFRENPDIDLVYGQRIYVDVHGLEIGRCVLPPHHAETLKWLDYVPQETLFWRRRVWESVGPFDETFEYALDWDFLLRAQAAGFRFRRLPRFMGCFRVHDAQKTTSIADVGAEEMLRLRIRYLGEMPGDHEIKRATTGYLMRQRLHEMMNRLGILGY
jgi:GT2 family glycosyltransferase